MEVDVKKNCQLLLLSHSVEWKKGNMFQVCHILQLINKTIEKKREMKKILAVFARGNMRYRLYRHMLVEIKYHTCLI